MRASPDFQIALQRFGAWRAAVFALALSGLAVIAAWAAGRVASAGTTLVPIPSLLAVLAIGVAVVWAAWSLTRVPASTLRWDGAHWWLTRTGPVDDEPIAGRLTVAIDLGPWMLLRFDPETTAATESRPAAAWLPAQRRGLEAQWHALRCAVHTPHAAPTAS